MRGVRDGLHRVSECCFVNGDLGLDIHEGNADAVILRRRCA